MAADTSATPAPTGMSTPTTTNRPGMGMRMAAAALILVGGILALVSAFTAWWSLSFSGSSISFFPGSSYTGSGFFGSQTVTYASGGIGPVGGLYEAILALVIIAGILGIVAGLLGLVAAMGRLPAHRHGMVKGLAIAAIVLALVAVILAPAVQPWAFHDSSNNGSCSGLGLNGSSPCGAFWGSASSHGFTVTWGAADGWYLALVAFVLTLVGFVLWRSNRN
jgi:hypothetical protein